MTQQEHEIVSVYRDWNKTASEFDALDHYFGIALSYLKAIEMLEAEHVTTDKVKMICRNGQLFIFWLDKRSI